MLAAGTIGGTGAPVASGILEKLRRQMDVLVTLSVVVPVLEPFLYRIGRLIVHLTRII